MFDNLKLVLVAVLATVAYNAKPTNAGLNMSNICLLLEDGLSIANENECGSYYSCQGAIANLLQCAAGLFFDKDSQGCVPPSQVSCTNAGQNPCAQHPVGSFMPVSGSCGGYYYCSPTGPVRGNCPLGENFNPVKQACAYSINYPCAGDSAPEPDNSGNYNDPQPVAQINLCNYVPNGYYFGSPSTCTGWNYCQDNVIQSGSCENGLEFNVLNMECDYSSNVNCRQVTNDPQLIDSLGGTCTKIGLLKAAGACNEYFYCDGSKYQLMQCPLNLYYDTVSQGCVKRMNARNNCDRCVGTTAPFVNSYSTTSCVSYLSCQNGVEIGEGTCPAGFYFNEELGACSQAAEPLFGCCNPSVYPGSSGTTDDPSDTEATTVDDKDTVTTK